VNDALLLHSKLNSKKLHVKIINPTYSKAFEKIKSYHNHHINVMIDYYKKVFGHNTDFMNRLLSMVKNNAMV
jgi:hypothetical protein